MKNLFVPAIVAGFCLQSVAMQQNEPTPAVPPAAAAAQSTSTEATQANVQAEPPSPQNLNKPIALRIVGSNVKNLKGEYLGRIEDVALNPQSKQIEFALLNVQYPTNSSRVTPVPWELLSYVWDQGQVGGEPGAVQLFRLDMDKSRLALAPSIERTHIADLMQAPFRQQLVAFYGGTPENIGATGSATASTAGGASGGVGTSAGTAATVAGTAGAGEAFPPEGFFVGPGGGFVVGSDTNPPASSTNNITVLVTNVFPGTTNTFITTNIFQGGTNIFVGTNVFRGGTNTFVSTNVAPGGTNVFAGATNTFFPRNVAAGASNVFPGDRPVPSPQQGASTPVLPATGRGSGTTVPMPPRHGGAPNSPWAPPSTQIIIPTPPPTAQPAIPGASAPNNDVGNSTPAPAPNPVLPPTPTLPPAPSPQPGTVAPRR